MGDMKQNEPQKENLEHFRRLLEVGLESDERSVGLDQLEALLEQAQTAWLEKGEPVTDWQQPLPNIVTKAWVSGFVYGALAKRTN
jgi:hypothetical protein